MTSVQIRIPGTQPPASAAGRRKPVPGLSVGDSFLRWGDEKMAKIPYWHLLRDPRWQRKRLEVMERANFRCEYCSDAEATLNVHHGYYERGLKPWEYEDATLWCLCEDCHKQAQDILRDVHYQIAKMLPGYLDNLMAPIVREEEGLARNGLGEETRATQRWRLARRSNYLSEVMNLDREATE